MPLTLMIYFPVFEIDVTTVDFDMVFVGKIAQTNFVVKNLSGNKKKICLTSK